MFERAIARRRRTCRGGVAKSADARASSLEDRPGRVRGSVVDGDDLPVGEGLIAHRLQRFVQERGRVVGWDDHADLGHRSLMLAPAAKRGGQSSLSTRDIESTMAARVKCSSSRRLPRSAHRPCIRRLRRQPGQGHRQRVDVARRHHDPVSPSSTISGMPATSVDTTGKPWAIASRITYGRHSFAERRQHQHVRLVEDRIHVLSPPEHAHRPVQPEFASLVRLAGSAAVRPRSERSRRRSRGRGARRARAAAATAPCAARGSPPRRGRVDRR